MLLYLLNFYCYFLHLVFQSREKDLLAELESLKEEKDDIESRLTSELKETQEKVSI